METKRVIKVTVEKSTKRPEKLNKSDMVFGLFMPERVKIQPGKVKEILMNSNIYIPENIFGIIVLSLSLQKENLLLRDYQYTIKNIRKVELELFNKTDTTTFDLRKRQKIACLMTIKKKFM